MSPKPILEHLASWTRFLLLAAIAVVLGLILTSPEYPLVMSRAHAEGLSAAPGFICTSIAATNSERFYLVDTNKQVICIYSVTNDQLRLQSARKFDFDANIPDGSHQITVGNKALKLEGNANGLSRDEAKDYGEAVVKMIENAKIKK